MRVFEHPFSRLRAVLQRQIRVLGRSSVQLKLLPVIPRVVVDRLKHRAVRAHQPFRRSQSMLLADLPPLLVSRPVARPPQQLQIHHRIDDGVVSFHSPGGNQLRLRIEQFLQPLCAAKRSRPQRIFFRQVISQRRRVVVQESRVVILLPFLPEQLGSPQLRPPPVFFVVGRFVHSPQLGYPEASRPEISVLLFPFAGRVVRFCEEPLPGLLAEGLAAPSQNRFPLRRRSVNRLLQ